MIKYSFTITFDDPDGNTSIETIYDSIIAGLEEFGYDIKNLLVKDNNTGYEIDMNEVEKESE